MKRLNTLLSALVMVWVCVGLVEKANAQDTLDVAPGYETLNLAIEGDTTDAGEPLNPNRVYRLERGGAYPLNGTIGSLSGHIVEGYPDSIASVHLRIVAAEGDGPLPMLIPYVGETGYAGRVFRPYGDCTFRDLYVSGIDNLGNAAGKNMFRCGKGGGRYVIDGCFLDHDCGSFIRMDAPDQKWFVTNTIMRNSFTLADPKDGRFLDTRGNNQDTIFVQNCTFYMCTDDPIKGGGILKNVIWDHVTLYVGAGFEAELDLERVVNARITNSLFIDIGFEGDIEPTDPAAALADSLDKDIIKIDSLLAPDLATDAERTYLIRYNVYGWTPEVLAWLDGIDTLQTYVWHNARTQRFIDTYPNMTSYGNIREYPEFTDAPDPYSLLAFTQYRLATNYSNENNPDARADRNGMAPLIVDPNSVGPAEDEYDFDYPTSKLSYTHARGGFPAGDLNWFPAKKTEWEAAVVAIDPDANTFVPDRFALDQNYPNPFNPSTTIAYRLNKATDVKLTVYNMLGQNILTLVNKKSQAGEYSVQWDGRNNAGNLVASGIYFYRLEAGDQIQVRKMLLMR